MPVSMNALVGFAESNHENPVQTTLLFDALDVDGYSYDYRGDSRLPLITYGTADVDGTGDLDALADPPASAEHAQQLSDRRRSISSGRPRMPSS